MNDDELMTALREPFTDVELSTSVEQIVRRGRAVRARRRIPAAAGTLAVVAGAAVAVSTLATGGHQPGGRPSAQLAAWTVARQSNGTIAVTINQLSDPAGLQGELRADGVPASVMFGNGPNPQPDPCQDYPSHGPAMVERVVLFQQGQPGLSPSTAMVISPAAIPSGAGLQIFTSQEHVGARLVDAAPGCTS